MRSTKSNLEPKKKDPNALAVKTDDTKSRERLMAEVSFSSEVINAKTVKSFSKGVFGEIDLTEAVGVMRELTNRVNDGSLSDLENTLTAQAATLNVIFNAMAQRAAFNMGEHMGACETYLRMALKAQAQCRATIETLAEVKYPKSATFVRQQNVAYQQQVNNSTNSVSSTQAPAHAHGETINQANELLNEASNATVDGSGKSKASGFNKELETVGVLYRCEDSKGQSCK